MNTVEPLLPELSTFVIEIAIEKLKRSKSPGTDRIPAELKSRSSRFNISNYGILPQHYTAVKASNLASAELIPARMTH
jgi:hypothetical protein